MDDYRTCDYCGIERNDLNNFRNIADICDECLACENSYSDNEEDE